MPNPTKVDVLQVGDVLNEPLYGRPRGARSPVLLLAAGQRIESERQLHQLREAGFTVRLPHEARPSAPTSAMSPPAVEGCPDAGEVSGHGESHLEPGFAQRLERAGRVRQTVTAAVRDLIQRVREGATPDSTLLQYAGASLVTEVSLDAQAACALTFLSPCDDYTVEHSADVAVLMAGIGHVLEMEEHELRMLALAGLLHDVGKQRVPVNLLTRPGALTAEEFEEIRRHPEYGAQILDEWGDCPAAARAVALQHHERLDGSGYPAGLKRPDLHPYSRIAAVADTFDAMTSNRPYRTRRPARDALVELYRARERHFDAAAVEALVKLVGVYPVGTRVLLNTGERGVVIAPNPEETAAPLVRVDHDRHGRPVRPPFSLSLRSGEYWIVRTLS